MKPSFEDITYSNINAKDALVLGSYDNCQFVDCHFSNTDLANFVFIDCVFIGCDFTNTKVANAAFRQATFENCKLLGLRFDYCNPMLLAIDFKNCNLSFSSFYQLSIPNTSFADCDLSDVDFEETNLVKASFTGANCANATFEKTNLEQADFVGARHFVIDPNKNNIKKATFSRCNLEGLVQQYRLKIVD